MLFFKFLICFVLFQCFVQVSKGQGLGNPPPLDRGVRGRSGRNPNINLQFGREVVDTLNEISTLIPLENGFEEDTHCAPVERECVSFFSQKFPTVDGFCNNRVNPNSGSHDRSFKRLIPADYADGHESLRLARNGQPLPSARAISNEIQLPSNTSTPSTHMLPFWGQFLVHDIALTLEPEGSVIPCDCFITNNSECINIPIPRSDPQYRSDTGRRKICFTMERSEGVPNSDDCSTFVRQQLNELSAFLDMGLIYGNSEAQVNSLRYQNEANKGELINVQLGSIRNILPLSGHAGLSAAADFIFCPEFVKKPPSATCRVSGEPRTNENSVLQSHHTVWMRLHNIVVGKLKQLNPRWDSDTLFENAKLIVTSMHQRITFQHFLPIILGDKVMNQFGLTLLKRGFWYGYDSSYDSTVANSFATAAFRMGHTLINEWFTRPGLNWNPRSFFDLRVKDSLFNINAATDFQSGGPSSFVRGLAEDSAMVFSPTFSDDLRNFLDAPNFDSRAFGNDLLSRNIQRGRDHGLPPYLRYRQFCGLSIARTFDDLDDIPKERIENLKRVYNNVDDIDLFAGGVSEISVEGGTVGPTFACIIGYQFRDLKRGDRFWHENAPPIGPFNQAQLAALRAIPFGRLLCEMIDLDTIQPWPMRKPTAENRRISCNEYPPLNLDPWREGYSSNVDIEQETVGTAWFPTNILEVPFTPSELYQWLVINRPTEVCRQVVQTKLKTVNGNTQVRFRCLPGTITNSDFPPILSDRYVWSRWVSSLCLSGQDSIVPRPPNVCDEPYAIQAQTLDGVPAGETRDVFRRFSPKVGLVCIGEDQTSRFCENYQVRFLCRTRN